MNTIGCFLLSQWTVVSLVYDTAASLSCLCLPAWPIPLCASPYPRVQTGPKQGPDRGPVPSPDHHLSPHRLLCSPKTMSWSHCLVQLCLWSRLSHQVHTHTQWTAELECQSPPDDVRHLVLVPPRSCSGFLPLCLVPWPGLLKQPPSCGIHITPTLSSASCIL